ncbi:PD-(D/E)XK nuclease-like domain-containing protein [Listeria booriae]|uniref:PD-(D/E)XK nuclease-like domain-containing protein n=1 Tax=Listeria booriae TaxID=1552123 RepID=UPI0021AB2EA1|nr:PD-(D/E)XK nuclease-like domain-containing protein [Listeria booriae]
MKQSQLTKDNYYSSEMNKEYMSVSQFKSFMSCEARTLAEINGTWTQEAKQAFLVGNYVHSAFESEEVHNEFIEANNVVIFKKNGCKYSDFETADRMIETVKNDQLSMFALDGEKEVIIEADLYGARWKAKIDVLNKDYSRFTDLKTTAELYKRFWSDKYNGWVSFVQAYDYVLQMAIYKQMIEQQHGGNFTPYIVAVTKQMPCDKAVIDFDPTRFDFEYLYVAEEMPRILKLKAGEIAPIRCNKCDYCRFSKVLNDTIEVEELLK